MQYVPPLNGDLENPDRPYVDADPAFSIQGSIPSGEALEAPMRELLALIAAAGIEPDAEDLTQVRQAVLALIGSAVADLVASSPEALDTLNELAAALGNDPNFATTVTNALAAKAPLSSPGFTDEPTAPTPAPGNNSTRLATTAFVAALFGTIAQATTAAPGLIEILTNAEFNTGTDSDRAVVASNFVKSIGASGYITLPGGLILQWGKTGLIADEGSATVTFPVAFPTACLNVSATGDTITVATTTGHHAITAISATQMTVRWNANSAVSSSAYWFAIGH